MSIREDQRSRLRRTIEWARKIEEELAEARRSRLGEVHFRPSSTGISMVGLRPDRPQRGKSQITNLQRLASTFEREFQTHCVDCDHGRPTPEKRLQSFLISNAYRHARRLEDLAGGDGDEELLFVTDELSLPTVERPRGQLCDVLALHGNRPAVIELKPARKKKELVKQATGYARLVEEHLELFSELFSVVLGREVKLCRPCQCWIVWPHPAGHDRDPQEGSLARLGVRVAGYTEVEDGFRFQVGTPVQG